MKNVQNTFCDIKIQNPKPNNSSEWCPFQNGRCLYTKYWLKGGTDINSAYSIEYMQGGRRDWIRLEVRVFDELFASAYLL